MLSDIVILIAGLALLVQGGNLFVAAAVRIAGFMRMPRVVIGSTIVSLATTMPEMSSPSSRPHAATPVWRWATHSAPASATSASSSASRRL